ncbi:partial Sensor kinase CckA, partial [Anaerolineae bacterium]
VLERAFEPFFTTKDLGKGTGLGLSTSMAIVTSHGGCISVDSAPDDGCTFTIWIPAAAAGQPSSRGADAAATLPAGRGETVLVVDDEQAIRHVMQRTLESSGYRVLLASNGAEALAAFVDHRDAIAAVITDMMMPVMDGKVLIASLRRMSETLPIIAASGLLDGAGGRDDPHTIHLAKPYALAALLQALQQVMRASPA